MSALGDRALRDAGLMPLLEARRSGDLERLRSEAEGLREVDLLPLGVLADRIRLEEVGDVVRIHTASGQGEGPEVLEVHGGGLALLRATAMARILGGHAARVRIDWAEVGLELAQVALGFGASELVGPLTNRRGLPIADDATKKIKGRGAVPLQALKRQELLALIRRTGRVPVFEEPQRPASQAPGVHHA